MFLPAAHSLEGKRQTLHPIYSNTARYQDSLSTTTPLLALAMVVSGFKSAKLINVCIPEHVCVQSICSSVFVCQ